MMYLNRVAIPMGRALRKHQPAMIRYWSSTSSNNNKNNDNNNNTDSIVKGGDDDDDASLIVSHFKNQIVQQLWTERAAAKKSTKERSTRCPSNLDQKGKTPCHSETQVEYPFTSNELLAESYRSPWNTIRMGRIFEDLDALAGNIAFYHVQQEGQEHPLIVTASVDRIALRKETPLTTSSDQVLSGRVTYVGSSSMEIRMHCTSKNDQEPWLEAFFTFVTLDPDTKKPIAITPLLPQTVQEQADFEAGAKRAAVKKERRIRHKGTASTTTTDGNDIQQQASALLKEARPLLLNMPSLAARDALQMSSTKMQNAMMAQPTVRNLHHRIFGGFLMRRAFELAFANAYVFGGARPVFCEVDEVSFMAPVDVGDLLVFNSRVLYTSSNLSTQDNNVNNHNNNNSSSSSSSQQPLVHLEVEAWVTVPEQADAKLSNQFYFTFAIVGDDDTNTATAPLRRILPANIDEATRMALRMEADREQAKHD